MIARSHARNRTWLAGIGLVSVVAGGLLVLLGTGLADQWQRQLPEGIELAGTDQTLDEAVAGLTWLPALVLGLSILVAVLVLTWLVRGFPRPARRPDFQLQQDGRTGVTVLPSKVLTSAVEEAAEEIPDVVGVSAHIGGRARRPEVLLVAEVDERGDLQEALRRLTIDVCGDLSRSLEARLGSVTVVLDPVLRTRSSSTATVPFPSHDAETVRTGGEHAAAR
ncbi:hypothetical protein [Nesterenkonia xinjiangensis]|uniref:Alkaline shock response membrane anchor protein AmaP n=1 Tax=Nesterenkonia xinjiangensis TaxID=225327 RepID=A0A7Z0GJA9_9MICC|nr:hypothetical protein [Nesterenkonia xinjiangensis]NYJ77027.1 hypothetical protein [Nesterenkonia xinjiangensis]